MCDLSMIEIENIADFMDGLEILLERNLTNESIIDLQDIKEILMLKYHPMKDEVTADLKKSVMCNKYSKHMSKLTLQLENVNTLMNCTDFQNEFGGLYQFGLDLTRDKMKNLRKLIDRKKFPILIAGEANAGKSSIVNLLLGCDLMPTDIVTCTKMICEVRNSTEKRVTFIKNESDRTQDKIISLENMNITEISDIVSHNESVNYIKGIFEHPVQFLDNFTVLVDSPGNTRVLDELTLNSYSESVPAFIFVLNATNAGGLNLESRKIISQARDELNREVGCLFAVDTEFIPAKYDHLSDKAIFILNHWDDIRKNDESNEIDSIRQSIIREIQTLWHKSATQGVQIFFMSATQAREWMNMGLIQRDVIKLRHSLINLVEKVYEKNFQNCLCLLNSILDHIEKIILRKINANIDNKYSKLNNKIHAEKVCSILKDLTKRSETFKEQIFDSIKPYLNSMVTSLNDHMKSDEVEMRIFVKFKEAMMKDDKSSDGSTVIEAKQVNYGNENQVTEEKKKADLIDIKYCILKKILEEQMLEELKIWEEKSKLIEKLYKFMNSLFEKQLYELSDKLNVDYVFIDKSSLMSAWNNEHLREMKMSDVGISLNVEKIFIVSAMVLIFPIIIVAGIFAAPLIIRSFINDRKVRQGKGGRSGDEEDEYLKMLLSKTLQNLSEDFFRQRFFSDLSDKCMEHVEAFNVFIQSELNEKHQLIEDIKREIRAIPIILQCMNNLLRRIEKYYGEYHVMRNRYLPDLSMTQRSSLYLMGNQTKPMIEETISMCQSSVVFRSKCKKDVVFKMYSKPFNNQYARFQMQEVNILSIGPFQYILQLRHMCYLEEEDKLLLILDNVECNLEQYFKNNLDLLPIYFNRGTPNWIRAFRFIIDVSKQLCTCLNILHTFDVRMVHPDLRIDTVLVSKQAISDAIKILICDVCSNLPTQRSHKRSNNSQAEVLELCFDMGGYTKENIYRLGIILYKMAYFNFEPTVKMRSLCLSDDQIELKNYFTSVEALEHEFDIDWSDNKHFNIPIEYNELIKKCMSNDPEDVPDAMQCFNILSDIHF